MAKQVPFMKLPNFKDMDCYQRADAFLRSEQRYVAEGLRVLYEIQNRLKCQEQLNMPILGSEDINTLYLNVDSIYRFSDGLLQELNETRWQGVDAFISNIPSILDKNIPFFKLYSSYILNVKKALKMLKDFCADKKKHSFKDFVMLSDMCYERGMDILMQTPVNRLPQYVRYIGAIAESLPENHPDIEALSNTVLKLQQVMDQISSTAENTTRRAKVVEIQQSIFKGDLILVDPTRKFLRSGRMKLRDGTKFIEYNFYLFSDFLMYAAQGMFGNMNLKGVMPLAGAKIMPMSGTPNTLRIVSGLNHKEWDLQAVEQEKETAEKSYLKWMTELHAAYTDLYGEGNQRGFNATVMHPEDFEAIIRKKTVSKPRMMPRPPAQPLDELVQAISKLNASWSKKQGLSSPAPAGAPVIPAKPTAHAPATPAPAVPSRPTLTVNATPTVGPRPAIPPKPAVTPSNVTVTMEELPTVVGDWERLVDPSSGDYYYEYTVPGQEYTTWDTPQPFLTYQRECIAAKKAGKPFPPVPAPSVAPVELAPVPEDAPLAAPVPADASVFTAPASAPAAPSMPTAPIFPAAPPAPVLTDDASTASTVPPAPIMPAAPALDNADSAPAARLPPPASKPNDLLSAIRGGAALRKVEAAPSPASGGSNDLLSAIRSGAQLRHVEVEEKKAVTPTNSLLSQIHSGVQLRKVERTEGEAPAQNSGFGIAGALQKSLANYRKFVQDDSDDDDEDDW